MVCLSRLFWAGLPDHPTVKGRDWYCKLLNSIPKGSDRQAQMVASHCQGMGVGESPWRFGEGAEMETWPPDPASLAAGPPSLLPEGAAGVLEGSGAGGTRAGSCEDRTG